MFLDFTVYKVGLYKLILSSFLFRHILLCLMQIQNTKVKLVKSCTVIYLLFLCVTITLPPWKPSKQIERMEIQCKVIPLFISQKMAFALGPMLVLTCNTVVWSFIMFIEKQSLYVIEKVNTSSETIKRRNTKPLWSIFC